MDFSEYSFSGSTTKSLVQGIEERTGLETLSFDYCYSPSVITLVNDGELCTSETMALIIAVFGGIFLVVFCLIIFWNRFIVYKIIL